MVGNLPPSWITARGRTSPLGNTARIRLLIIYLTILMTAIGSADSWAGTRLGGAMTGVGGSFITHTTPPIMPSPMDTKSVVRRAKLAATENHNRGNNGRRVFGKATKILAPAALGLALSPAVASATGAAAAGATALGVSAPGVGTYHLTRILFLRFLAVVHIAAFSVAKFQNRGLIGDRGITPARWSLDGAQLRGERRSARRREWASERANYSRPANEGKVAKLCSDLARQFSDSQMVCTFRDKFWFRADRIDRPLISLLWFAKDREKLNPWLDGLAHAGLFLSTVVLATGSANVPTLLGLWTIQRSLMSVGGPWYWYGWEPQLAELTFHALFLVPMWSMNPFFGWGAAVSNTAAAASGAATSAATSGAFPVPVLIIWAIRFYLFKIMMGAGLIKLKSPDPKWKPGNMSAMDYFYETQPVPNPFTRYFHFMPKAWHRFEVWSNHFVELVSPFLLLMPFRRLRIAGALIQIMFQSVLISSGNLSFLNWLTIVPALLCLDDAFLLTLPPLVQTMAFGTPTTRLFIDSMVAGATTRSVTVIRGCISIAFTLLIANLSVNVVKNLLGKRQLMNASFDKLRIVSSYGAFGVVAEERDELIIESANDIAGPWKEYHFKVKPGNVMKRPRWISPYHHRLDWQMWIASQCGGIERSSWLYSFLLKLLKQEKDVLSLIDGDPWAGIVDQKRKGTKSGDLDEAVVHAPTFIRIVKYRYKFYHQKYDEGSEVNSSKMAPYWVRERVGRYFPRQGVATAAMLEELGCK